MNTESLVPSRFSCVGAVTSAAQAAASAFVVAALCIGSAAGAESLPTPDGQMLYQHPVAGVVIDFFDPSAGQYAAGNRGWDYFVFHNQTVKASGPGTIVFAGKVAGDQFVTILHADGLRSSYSYLSHIGVTVGQRVVQGESIGSTTQRFQLGFRQGDIYIDPAGLIWGKQTARLVR